MIQLKGVMSDMAEDTEKHLTEKKLKRKI